MLLTIPIQKAEPLFRRPPKVRNVEGEVEMSRRIGRCLNFIDFGPVMWDDALETYFRCRNDFVHRNSTIASEAEMTPVDRKLLRAAETFLKVQGWG